MSETFVGAEKTPQIYHSVDSHFLSKEIISASIGKSQSGKSLRPTPYAFVLTATRRSKIDNLIDRL